MKNSYGWNSEYRRKKFEKRYREKYKPLKMEPLRTCVFPNTIAVMLDIEGTCDNIDDGKAREFVRMLDEIRKKFEAASGLICISTHCINSRKIKKVLEVISRNLSSTISIGTSYFYGGTYDFASGEETTVHPTFNLDKVGTFMENYVKSACSQNVWFAIIDDSIEDDVYKRLPSGRPALIGKPSSEDAELEKNTLLRIASTSRGFDGVIEIMRDYLETIYGKSVSEIKASYRDIEMHHLSSYELLNKVTNREFGFLKRYFKEGYADEDDYEDALDWIMMLNRGYEIAEEEIEDLSEILFLIESHFRKNKQSEQMGKAMSFREIVSHS